MKVLTKSINATRSPMQERRSVHGDFYVSLMKLMPGKSDAWTIANASFLSVF
jgi:hypothetical protein